MTPVNENLRLLKPFLRGLPVIALVVALAVMAARRYLRYATPMYESTARIRLADTKDGAPGANLYKDFDIFTSAHKIGAELEVIKSKLLINKTLDSLGFDITTYRIGQLRKSELYHQCPFRVSITSPSAKWYDKPFVLQVNNPAYFTLQVPGQDKYVTGQWGQVIRYDGGEIRISKNDSLLATRPGMDLAGRYEFVWHSRPQLIEKTLAALDVGSVDKEIPVLRINYKSAVPQKAAHFVTQLAETYVRDYIETKCKTANTTVGFLNQQLQEMGGRLAASENAIESYRDKKRIINIRQETETDLRKIADMKVQQTNVRMNLEAIEDLNDYMKTGRGRALELAPNFEAYTDLLATEMVKKMKLLQAEKKDLLIRYTPEHEQVKVIDNKLADITTYLEEGINNTRKNLQIKYERITRDINEAERAFDGLATKEKTMGILNRNFSLNEQTYNFLHEKRTEAQIAQAATIAFHRIISPGDVPQKPVSPNSTLLTVLAAFLGFLGAVLLIYIVHGIKGKVNDVHTIEKNTAIPVAATTPQLAKPAQQQQHFHQLAIRLEIKNMLLPNGVLAISSFDKKEGKAFNTWRLAKALAAQQKNILVIDADGGLQPQLPVALPPRIHCISLVQAPAICLNSNTLQAQIADWKNEYDCILIKNEALRHTANGLLLMKAADANLLLFDARRTAARTVTEAEVLQQEYGFSNLQVLLNRAGYNPSIIRQVFHLAQQLVQRIIRHKKAAA
jgi:uncharacterized protein involved in exopolysaccharide biosynthesis